MAITKKTTREMELKLLKIFYADYLEDHGEGTRKLNEYSVLTTSPEAYVERMPELREVEGNTVRYLLLDLHRELEASGMMRSEGGLFYYLTEAGYRRASMKRWEAWLDFANRNAGLAIPIAILSFIVSIFALFVGD